MLRDVHIGRQRGGHGTKEWEKKPGRTADGRRDEMALCVE
jgi:hypothetical protein